MRSVLTRPVLLAALALPVTPAWAAPGPAGPDQPSPGPEAMAPSSMPKTLVTGESGAAGTLANPFPAAVEGTRIYAGKKATLLDFDALPQVQTDNYRQALARTPGLLVSELSNNSLLSLTSRGIGDPHETQNLLVLKDGIPFVADLYGYPTVYYAPPFESLDRLEFIRGGASLIYGPQPGGALNYVTHLPRRDRPFAIRSQQLFGSYHLYTTHTLVEGTVGRVGYLATFDHRQGDSFRRLNSDFEVDSGSARLTWEAGEDGRWTFDFDGTRTDSGEPGGLTFATGPGALNYDEDRRQTQKPHDRIRVERYLPSVTYERDLGTDTLVTARLWGGSFERSSQRQQGDGFGTVGGLREANNIDVHQYYTFGSDFRARHDWQLAGGQHTLAAGVGTYWSDAPIRREQGATADAETGALVRASQRDSVSGSVFAENLFHFGPLSLVPGFRLDTIHQGITETFNLARPNALLEDSHLEVVPLVALGATWRLGERHELFGNVSQGYKAATYADAIPVDANNAAVSDDLQPGRTWTYEVGFRGRPTPWFNYDASVFLIDYDDRFGRVLVPGTQQVRLDNVGRSINQGVDVAVEVDVVGWLDQQRGTRLGEDWGSLSLYANASLLDARFVSGPLDGRTPQYAPDSMIRSGLLYRLGRRARVGFLGTFVDAHYANDTNDAHWLIPGYMVWDLTAEVELWTDHLKVIAGLNNVFDEDYYSRIRSNGVDPAIGRNGYVGLSLAY